MKRMMGRYFRIGFIVLAGLLGAVSGLAEAEPLPVDFSTPDSAVKTFLNAIYREDAGTFIKSFSGKYKQQLMRPEKFTEEKIRSYLSGNGGKFNVDDYVITDILETGNKARVELGMRDPSAFPEVRKAAYILEKENEEWKITGRDFLRKENLGWEYTRSSDRFTLIRKL